MSVMGLYEKIREDNVVKYGTKVGDYIPIIINQYSERTHFIYEILQNAEDAEATKIDFNLYADRIEIRHNGRLFNEKDITGVCGIAEGTKADGTRIGHFGIGFKAVYGYTEKPEIYSGQYSFEIRNYLNPYPITPMKSLPAGETCMVLPFNKESVSPVVAYKEIKEALTRKITAESVIMLNRILDISINIEQYPEAIEINKEKGSIGGSDNVFELSMLTTYRNKSNGSKRETESTYLFFTDAEPQPSAVVFKVEGKELQEIRNSKIYAFFPTAKEAHQKFYIQAPFDTTPARDNFKEGEDFGSRNVKLIDNIGNLIYGAFCWLRDNGYLTFSGFNKVFPIYEYEETDILYAIYRKSVDIINSGEKLLPTNREGVFKGINEICVPENMGIVNVFNDEDLQRLTGNRKLYWLSKEISTNAYVELKRFLDRNFDFQTFEWRHLVLKMDAAFLSSKDIKWMEHLMSSIESACIKRGDYQSHYMDVSGIPFVRLVNGEQICARVGGKFQVYLNNPAVCKNKIDDAFRKSDIICSFYGRALGIPVYDLEREVIDKILPKYTSRDVKFVTSNHIKENIEDLKEIKDALAQNPGLQDYIKDRFIVTDGKGWYRPAELYIPSDDIRVGYSIVKGILNIHYLASSYFDDTVMQIRLDQEFFKKIGCNLGLRKRSVSEDAYLQAVEKYCGRATANDIRFKIFMKKYISKKYDWSFCFEGFPEVFSGMTLKRSLEIARFLNRHINTSEFDIQGELVGADDQHFGGRSVDSVLAYSMLGLLLCFEKWLYVTGCPEPKSVSEIDRADLVKDYAAAQRLMDKLPFKEVKNGLTEFLEANISDKSKIDLVKRYMSDPEKLVEFAEAFAKSEAKRAAREEKRGSILDRIENGNVHQDKPNTDGEFEVNPISEKAQTKRERALEDELAASLDQHVRVARGLTFTRRESSKEERAFLEAEYGGYCQICETTIGKYDGTNYFEAINIIKWGQLKEEYANSVELGWNSLCLCPNCAARFNYSSKKISTIYEQVMEADVMTGSDDPIEIFIELPEGTEKKIKYSPRHFMALKHAFKVFSEE